MNRPGCFFGRWNLINRKESAILSTAEPCRRPVVTIVLGRTPDGTDVIAFVCQLHADLLKERNIARSLREMPDAPVPDS